MRNFKKAELQESNLSAVTGGGPCDHEEAAFWSAATDYGRSDYQENAANAFNAWNKCRYTPTKKSLGKTISKFSRRS